MLHNFLNAEETKKCITYVVQPEYAAISPELSLSLSIGLSIEKKNRKIPEPRTAFVSVWAELWPHALGSGHKKQFSGTQRSGSGSGSGCGCGCGVEAEVEATAAITITCFVINYSLRNAGDRPKTTTVTVTQGSRKRQAGRQEARLDHVLLLLQRILLLEKRVHLI